MSETPDRDGQDGAEAYDALLDGEPAEALEGRTFEELPEVRDLTQAEGDSDEDEAVAIDAAEFDPDTIDDGDLEEDDELRYRAATEARQDDLDGQGPEDRFDAGRVARSEVEGLEVVRDAGDAEGGEDDFTDFQSRKVGDADLKELGYAEDREGETRARPDRA